jgi:MoaA/NifB/PqqE/SkfB family radical SAM enzyme
MELNFPRLILFATAIIRRDARKANISVTNRCNLRCRTCNIWRTYERAPQLADKELRTEDYVSFFDNYDFWNWISLTGGEPFLRKDLVDIVSAAYERCKGLHTVSIPTNGYLTDKTVHDVEEILSLKIPSVYVSISLDGLREVHDSNRGVLGSFDHAISTFNRLRKVRSRRLKVHLEYLISRYNQGLLSQVIEGLGLTPNDFIITIAQKSHFYDNMSLNIEPAPDVLLRDINWFLASLKIRSIHDFAQQAFLKETSASGRIPCVAGKWSFYVDPYGKIFPCVLNQTQLGTVRDYALMRFEASAGCRCYTPCESYFAILSSFPKTVLRPTLVAHRTCSNSQEKMVPP